jgi:hypothetical protein
MVQQVLRVLAAVALGVSGYVHLHLAHRYAYPGTISGTDLFRAQGVIAIVVAVVLLATGHRWAWAAAALVGLSSFGAVMLYRYVDVGAIGPLPNMYDATWQPSPDKLLSALVEIALPVLWAIHLAVRTHPAARPEPVAAHTGRQA